MKLVILVLCSLLGASALAQNPIYRCKDSTGKALFSDNACSKSADAAQVSAAVTLEHNTPPRNPYIDMATGEIKAALRGGDIAKAERLATTSEHYDMLREARQNKARIDAEVEAEANARKAENRRRTVLCQTTSTGFGNSQTTCR